MILTSCCRTASNAFRFHTFAVVCSAVIGLQQNSVAAQVPWTPEKTIEITVPGGAGGGIDTQARTVERILKSQRLVNMPIVIVNKSGGSASIGLTYISQQAPDGLHIAMGSSALLTNHITGKSGLHYKDLTALPQLAIESISFSVKADSEITSGKDLLERWGKDPASVRVGVPSVASSNHIAAALMVKAAGGDPKRLRTVVFNSSAGALTALLGGHIDVVASPALNTIPHLKRGALRVVAVTAPKRLSGDLSAIPTAREFGADVVIGAYRSVLGPKGMSPEAIAYWDSTFARMVETQGWREFMQKNSWEDNFMPSTESATFMKARYDAFKSVLAELGLVKGAP